MLTFREFLTEGALNFDTQDITPEGKKAARQQLAKLGGFTAQLPKMQPFFKKATDANMKNHYNNFLAAFPKEAKAIDRLKPDGVGPGELILYFVFDNVGIGGKNAPIDIYLNSKEYAEAKGGDTREGGNILTNFKITKDSAKAVTQLMRDLEDFNAKHSEITGEDLPGWRGANELTPKTLISWADIDLKEMAASNKEGSKKPIDLVLKKNGDLIRRGVDDPIVNVKTDKSVAPIKKLIDASSKVAVDDKISTLDKIVKRWVDQAFIDYVEGKKFVLFLGAKGDRLPQMKFIGQLTKDIVGLYCTHRNQPWAEVYLEPKKSEKTEGKKAK